MYLGSSLSHAISNRRCWNDLRAITSTGIKERKKKLVTRDKIKEQKIASSVT